MTPHNTQEYTYKTSTEENANVRSIRPNEIFLDIDIQQDFNTILSFLQAKNSKKILIEAYKIGQRPGGHIHIYYPFIITNNVKKALKEIFLPCCLNPPLTALENKPHFKSGQIKKMIWSNGTI